MGFLPVDRLKEIAARYGASITEYLSAVLLQSILENQEVQRPRRPRPAALAIPIDLRGWFPSATLRNFILTVRLCVDPTLGPYTSLSWSDTSTTTCACTSIPRRCGPASPAMSTSQPTAFSS